MHSAKFTNTEFISITIATTTYPTKLEIFKMVKFVTLDSVSTKKVFSLILDKLLVLKALSQKKNKCVFLEIIVMVTINNLLVTGLPVIQFSL